MILNLCYAAKVMPGDNLLSVAFFFQGIYLANLICFPNCIISWFGHLKIIPPLLARLPRLRIVWLALGLTTSPMTQIPRLRGIMHRTYPSAELLQFPLIVAKYVILSYSLIGFYIIWGWKTSLRYLCVMLVSTCKMLKICNNTI